MITKTELNTVELSPTKKDFYQIWNELLEIAGNLSERWDPTSTNESDPGIVLLKVLTAVADKINYTIDANTLEAFMPSAAQEESMRKLTDMLGYSMKYFQSATTDVKIAYTNSDNTTINVPLLINKYTNIKDVDNSVNYITLEDIYLNSENTYKIVPCIEGELVECETDDNNIVSLFHLDDNKRYFLPETQIAENGIFITNIINGVEGELWKKVDNLNTQNIGSLVYKFGYDSREDLPYVQFPDDISTIIEDGLKIKYLRTKGANGNISARTLCKMETPSSWSLYSDNSADYLNIDYYNISNIAATNNGRDKESLNDAYTNYKKTIGTFDTLVTCRDYMNKIYQMTTSETSSVPLVSNIIVSDIRDDINQAMTLCTFTERGIEYKSMAKPIDLSDATAIKESDYNSLIKDSEDPLKTVELGTLYRVHTDSNTENTLFYARCIYDGAKKTLIKINNREITHFDLVMYPFKTIYGLNEKSEYIKSFKYDNSNLLEIQSRLEENKTLSHNFIEPNKDDIACIKNYYKLTAKVHTTKKVNAIEQSDILGKVYSKLYENFNMRKVEFGEELPYDSILKVLENADPRIKSVILEEPTIVTKFCSVSGAEYAIDRTESTDTDNNLTGARYYNKTVLNNVLAGRVELFNYDDTFKADYTEKPYPSWIQKDENDEDIYASYDLLYPSVLNPEYSYENGVKVDKSGIHELKSSFTIDAGFKDLKLQENEVVQFSLPNLRTTTTYPAYVNYFAKLNSSNIYSVQGIPATMQTLLRFIEQGKQTQDEKKEAWENAINKTNFPLSLLTKVTSINLDNESISVDGKIKAKIHFNYAMSQYHALFIKNEIIDENSTTTYTYEYVTDKKFDELSNSASNTIYYYARFNNKNNSTDFGLWRDWILSFTSYPVDTDDESSEAGSNYTNSKGIFKGIYKNNGTDYSKSCGYLVDESHIKYKLVEVWSGTTNDPFTNYFVPRLWSKLATSNSDTSARACHTTDGLGQNAEYGGIPANTEYTLQPEEYLLINYTSSSTTDGSEVKTKINKVHGPGDIIKPNFDLIDSEEWRKTHRYPKTDGFNFSEFSGVDNPEGMFTLSTNEQIEIRELVSVKLDEISTNIYWIRNDETPDKYGRIPFIFNEDKDTETNKYLSYTLKDGEYLFYTGASKTDLAWYGSGTKVTRTKYTPEIYKYSSDTSVSIDTIAVNGLNADIPWSAYNFSKNGGFDRSLLLTEYQYINLVEGDTLCTVADASKTETDPEAAYIETTITSTEPVPISGASYILKADSDNKIVKTLPKVSLGPDIKWNIKSKLEFNIGPSLVQTLHNRSMQSKDPDPDKQNSVVSAKTAIEVLNYDSESIVVLEAQPNVPLSVKANKIYQTSTSEISTTTKEYSTEGTVQKETADLQLKVFKTANTVKQNGDTVNFNNFGQDYTKITFEENFIGNQAQTSAAFKLNTIIPENRFGLIMVYNNKVDKSTNSVRLRAIKANPITRNEVEETNIQQPTAPKIFNYVENWWEGTEPDSLNLNAYGKISENNTLWAVENDDFKKLSSSELKALYDTGVQIYSRTASVLSAEELENLDSILPAEGEIQRIDYNANPIVKYTYTPITTTIGADDELDYGTLLNLGGINETLYHLRQGINIIKIENSCNLEFYASGFGGAESDTIVISNINIIKFDSTDLSVSINKKLKYNGILKNSDTDGTISSYDQILQDIKKLDPNYLFYYNTPVQNVISIDMNANDPEDTLMHASNWYDINNVNNKFVISEIDADYLRTGVTIAKTSRSN